MATATNFLLQKPNLIKRNHYNYHYPPIIQNHYIEKKTFSTPLKISSNFIPKYLTIKCFYNDSKNGSLPSWQKPLRPCENPLPRAALFVGLLLMYDPNSVWAASGGRMGGSSFSSRSSGSSSSSSRSSSSSSWPKTRSYSHKPSNSNEETDNDKAVDYSTPLYVWIIIFVVASLGFSSGVIEANLLDRNSVGLLGLRRRSLQKYLNRIAETSDTSTPEGLHYVLTETINALLEHPDFRIYVDSSVEVKYKDGDRRFDELSLEERSKFDKETLVNINNTKEKQSSTKLTTTTTTGITNEYIVVTILVAAKGVHKLPSIKNIEDLKEALGKLASIPSTRILGVEVLWTPQEEDDTLSEEEFLEDYPLLRPLSGAESKI
ncbi:hypothetical protein ACJIZ3_006371 [Penstemon smallii]|uniref:Uncharacterized protein n=1 Tax=Penstemon smallii TaxID=265156 RepID=A0ABD3S7Q2_9LAMI